MIIVAGVSPSLDLTYLVPELRLGEIQRTSEVVRCAGGKPFNMARVANTLGSGVCVVAILGGATGAELAGAVTAAGIELVVINTPEATRTCVSIAAADTGTLTEVYQNAAPVPEPVWSAFVAELASVLDQRSGWLVITGGSPAGLEGSALAELVDLGQRSGFRVAVDTYGPALRAAVAARPDLVKVNRVEAAELLSAAPDAGLLEMATELQTRTGRLVVLTDGVHGAALADARHRVRAEPMPSVGHYPVGSGDAFLAGLVVGLSSSDNLELTLRTAVACGVANALQPGPGNLQFSDVRRLRGQIEVTSAKE